MITNYTNRKSSIPITLANVVLELEQLNTGHTFFCNLFILAQTRYNT